MRDQNFDGLVAHFKQKIYGSLKGQIRLQLLKNELQQYLQQKMQHQSNKPLKILDIAGGLGQLSIWLASMGHEVTYVDISQEMLNTAQQKAKQADVFDAIHWINQPFQQVVEQYVDLHASGEKHPFESKPAASPFDLILAHAVLEWLAEPYEGLHTIMSLVSSQSTLSLTFYNRQAILLHNLLRGNFRKVLSDNFRGDAGGLTPLNPLNPDEVRAFITANHLTIKAETGLRSFYDYLPKAVKEKISAKDILQMEQRLAHQQPFIDMARYLHFLVSDKDCQLKS